MGGRQRDRFARVYRGPDEDGGGQARHQHVSTIAVVELARRCMRTSRCLAIVLLLVMHRLSQAQMGATGIVRGVVRTDDGRGAENVEVTARSEAGSHTVRSDNAGRYSIVTEVGRNVVTARLPGYRPEEDTVTVTRSSAAPFDPLLRRVSTLDTVVVRATPIECRDPTTLEGFNCRHLNSPGIFLDQLTIQKQKPYFMGDVFFGLANLETFATKTGRSVRSKDGRCIQYLREGRPIVGRPPEPNDLLGVEIFEKYEDVPYQYRTYSWNPPGRPFPPTIPCIIINFWTRTAQRR